MPYTLRQLVLMYESAIMHDWDQTHLLNTGIVNIPIFVRNMFAKNSMRATTFLGNHHLRRGRPTGFKLTPSNLHVLKGFCKSG
jgi:hypothetical protein